VLVNQISLQGDSLEIEFVIKDSGIGIPPHKMVDLFKPFSQMDSSMARSNKALLLLRIAFNF
jgi:signal transduction histidine kinase